MGCCSGSDEKENNKKKKEEQEQEHKQQHRHRRSSENSTTEPTSSSGSNSPSSSQSQEKRWDALSVQDEIPGQMKIILLQTQAPTLTENKLIAILLDKRPKLLEKLSLVEPPNEGILIMILKALARLAYADAIVNKSECKYDWTIFASFLINSSSLVESNDGSWWFASALSLCAYNSVTSASINAQNNDSDSSSSSETNLGNNNCSGSNSSSNISSSNSSYKKLLGSNMSKAWLRVSSKCTTPETAKILLKAASNATVERNTRSCSSWGSAEIVVALSERLIDFCATPDSAKYFVYFTSRICEDGTTLGQFSANKTFATKFEQVIKKNLGAAEHDAGVAKSLQRLEEYLIIAQKSLDISPERMEAVLRRLESFSNSSSGLMTVSPPIRGTSPSRHGSFSNSSDNNNSSATSAASSSGGGGHEEPGEVSPLSLGPSSIPAALDSTSTGKDAKK